MNLSDHFAVNFNINIVQHRTGLMKIRYRKTRTIDTVFVRRDIPLFRSNDLDALNVDELVDQYDNVLVSLMDSHAPMLEKQIRLRQDTVWYTHDLRVENRTKRQRERSWRKSRLEVNRQLYADLCKRVNALLTKTKCAYYSSKIRDTGKNQQRLYRIVNCLLHHKVGTMLPTYTSEAEMAGLFSSHFLKRSATYVVSCLSVPTEQTVRNTWISTTPAHRNCLLSPYQHQTKSRLFSWMLHLNHATLTQLLHGWLKTRSMNFFLLFRTSL